MFVRPCIVRTTMWATTRCNRFRLLIFLNQLYMFRATNSPIFRSTFWLYIQLLVQCTDIAVTGRQQYRCIVPKAVCRVKKCFWGWASLSPETCRADLKRPMNEICCILLVAYIVVWNLAKYEEWRNFGFTRTSLTKLRPLKYDAVRSGKQLRRSPTCTSSHLGRRGP